MNTKTKDTKFLLTVQEHVHNKKVDRLLDSIALVVKDENPKLIEALHKVINDERDGYEFDFISRCQNFKSFVLGGSY